MIQPLFLQLAPENIVNCAAKLSLSPGDQVILLNNIIVGKYVAPPESVLVSSPKISPTEQDILGIIGHASTPISARGIAKILQISDDALPIMHSIMRKLRKGNFIVAEGTSRFYKLPPKLPEDS